METAKLSKAEDPLYGKKTAQLLKTLHIISEVHIPEFFIVSPTYVRITWARLILRVLNTHSSAFTLPRNSACLPG